MAKVGPEASRDHSSRNTFDSIVKSNGKHDISFQRMENGSPEGDFEERDDPMLSPAAIAARERRQGPPTPDNSMDFPDHVDDQPPGTQPHEGGGQATGSHNGQSGADASSASAALVDNKRLRTAMETLMNVSSMPLPEAFVQYLDQVVLAGAAGKELLNEMIAKVSQGETPANRGDFDIPPTQEEITDAATRLANAKAATDKANNDTARLEAERREDAVKKATEDVAASKAYLGDLLTLEENALRNAQRNITANPAGVPLPPIVPNIIPSVSRTAPNLIPVRTGHLPDIGQGHVAGADGTQRIAPLEEAMRIVEEEKLKVKTYHEKLMEKREQEKIP